MSNPQVTTNEYFGGCPECGQFSDCFNNYKDHWMVCHQHMTKWFIGTNLFSSWQDEDEAVWEKNRNLLERYREIDLIPPPTTKCPRCGTKAIGFHQFSHSPLCHNDSGRKTNLSDDTVRDVLKVLKNSRYYIAVDPSKDELPF